MAAINCPPLLALWVLHLSCCRKWPQPTAGHILTPTQLHRQPLHTLAFAGWASLLCPFSMCVSSEYFHKDGCHKLSPTFGSKANTHAGAQAAITHTCIGWASPLSIFYVCIFRVFAQGDLCSHRLHLFWALLVRPLSVSFQFRASGISESSWLDYFWWKELSPVDLKMVS